MSSLGENDDVIGLMLLQLSLSEAAILSRVNKNCHRMSNLQTNKALENRAVFRWRVLREAIRRHADDTTVVSMAKIPRACVLLTDGNLPLHDAIEHRRSPAVIRALLEKNIEAAKQTSKSGNLPLYDAIAYHRRLGTPQSSADDDIFLQVVTLLIPANPEALSTPVLVQYGDHLQNELSNQLPVYIFIRKGVCFEVIQAMVQAYPQALTSYAEDFRMNYSAWDEAGAVRDIDINTTKEWFLPLHVALLYGVDQRIIQLLVRKAPLTIREVTRQCNETPLILALEADTGIKNPDLAFCLWREWPDALLIENDENLIPLDMEIMSHETSKEPQNPKFLIFLLRKFIARYEEVNIGDCVHNASTQTLINKFNALAQTGHTTCVIQLLEEMVKHEALARTQGPYASVGKLSILLRNYKRYVWER